jgi:hypothetical protein
MRNLSTSEMTTVSGGISPRLVTITTNPGGVVNKSGLKNPNTETFTFKVTGKPA